MSQNIRVRFAPSPTGYLHIGGARTAIFNYLFARSRGGKFILRIEDTDIDRSIADSEDKILEDMNWLGIKWDEGPDTGEPGTGVPGAGVPDIGGLYGPYRQTQRLSLYNAYAQKLLAEGKAYYCWCTPGELEEKRKEALSRKQTPRYDGTCANLTDEERQKLQSSGRKAAVRFKTSAGHSRAGESVIIDDLIKGKVEFKEDFANDFVILKSDGTATYNFAVVIDDSLMKISHVIRGDEHLVNTPRQVMIYEALGFSLPKFAHIPMILAPDHTKLSKRHGTTSVGEFREKGFLAEALVNYLALLGWAPKDDKEFFTLEELVNEFSLERVAKNPAIYDIAKLAWMNAQYIKKMPLEEISKITNISKDIVEALLPRVSSFEDVRKEAEIFTQERAVYDEEALEVIGTSSAKELFKILKEVISQYDKVDETNYKDIMKKASEISGFKGKDLYPPVRAALIGKLHGPELIQIFKIFGIKKIISRLDMCLASR